MAKYEVHTLHTVELRFAGVLRGGKRYPDIYSVDETSIPEILLEQKRISAHSRQDLIRDAV